MTLASLLGLSVLLASSPVAGASIDKEVIRGRIRAKTLQVRACYEKALQKDPELEGKVVVKFVIGREGKVLESTGTGLPVVKDCVADVVKTIEFPPTPRDPVTVFYPFVFAPGRR